MKVVPIHANEDNYQYLIVDDAASKKCAIVDPVNVDNVSAKQYVLHVIMQDF